MESQVDFLHHTSLSNEPAVDDTTASLMDENLLLRQENQRLLEQFHQKIHACCIILRFFS